MLPLNLILSLVIMAVLPSLSTGHMNMAYPPPRGYKNNAKWKGEIDYTIHAPLSPERPFPCQGKPKGEAVLTVTPGDTISVKVEGSAPHGGGHCQFVLGYGSGGSIKWVVIDTVFKYCMINGNTYPVKIPQTAPGGDVVFAWTWINALGNREYYMNCADIRINSSGTSTIRGLSLLVANLPGYPTIPEFHVRLNQYDGTDILMKRSPIEVSGSGQVVGGGNLSSQKIPKSNKPPVPKTVPKPKPQENCKNSQKNPSKPTWTKHVYKSNAPGSKIDVSNNNGNAAGPCVIGEMKCFGNSKWGQCSTGLKGNQWYIKDCATGLKCTPYIGTTIQCQ
ncbi:hypothetical protein BKA69DRAFT_1123920 [Paraphysoderma sedebokerense]|nr:hypothetical protein BKA69DRAFT_1123920 [Paraphysoderma sedebokerense]